jgi:hypothetical protein
MVGKKVSQKKKNKAQYSWVEQLCFKIEEVETELKTKYVTMEEFKKLEARVKALEDKLYKGEKISNNIDSGEDIPD